LETYWKSSAMAYALLAPLHPRTTRRPNHIGSVQTSPYLAKTDARQTLTISSLHGDYIYVVLQVTRDLHPVVCFDWFLPDVDFEIGVADVTLVQFESLSRLLGRSDVGMLGVNANVGGSALSRTMVSLDRLLKVCI
jgi:CDK inhibitor PHO81